LEYKDQEDLLVILDMLDLQAHQDVQKEEEDQRILLYRERKVQKAWWEIMVNQACKA